MKVIAGIAKGISLLHPLKSNTRPMTNLLKGRLFDMISGSVINSMVLDVYAGTGSVGIEALSRGASKAVFVEKNYSASQAIIQNLKRCNFSETGKLINDDSIRFINRNTQQFDFVFATPPYRKKHYSDIILCLDYNSRILNPNGLLVIECSKHERENLHLNHFQKMNEVCSDDSILEFWKHRHPNHIIEQ